MNENNVPVQVPSVLEASSLYSLEAILIIIMTVYKMLIKAALFWRFQQHVQLVWELNVNGHETFFTNLI